MTTTRIGEIRQVGDESLAPGTIYVLRSSFNEYAGKGEQLVVETLHVMSRPSGGEVRGYRRVGGVGAWRLRLPASPVEWPELDAAVAALVGDLIDTPGA